MSGIAGVIDLGGALVDRQLVARMGDALRRRGPDGLGSHIAANVGLVHSTLCVDAKAPIVNQPLTTGGRSWIVADARLDARSSLIRELEVAGVDGVSSASDAELILRAYRVWGDACVDHLVGDFAFAIWDEPRRVVFCARDQLGVKPFFYAHAGQAFIFSNALDCVRLHPGISVRINELWVADFLLFGYGDDPASTVFSEVFRLPPGHCAVAGFDGVRTRRYWSLPIEEPLYYRRRDEYADQFRQLVRAATSARLEGDEVGVFMSGGLDSTTLAVVACEVSRERNGRPTIRAHTTVLNEHSDPEQPFASLVAERLGIPIEFRDLSRERLEPLVAVELPEPSVWPLELAAERAYQARLGLRARVYLFGEGPDNALLYEWRAYLAFLRKQRRWARIGLDLLSGFVVHKRLPLLTTLPRMIRERARQSPPGSGFPDWLNESLVRRHDLRDRWREHQAVPSGGHPARPRAYHSFRPAKCQSFFESFDAANTGAAVEYRHPYYDLALLRFMLRAPAVPWCRRKHLLRFAMRNDLPRAILERPKTPGSPVPAPAKRKELSEWIPLDQMWHYAIADRVRFGPDDDQDAFDRKCRALGLDCWLRGLSQQLR